MLEMASHLNTCVANRTKPFVLEKWDTELDSKYNYRVIKTNKQKMLRVEMLLASAEERWGWKQKWPVF